jgi:hypothetical protein
VSVRNLLSDGYGNKNHFWRVIAKIYHIESVIPFSEFSLSIAAERNIFKLPRMMAINLVTVKTCSNFSAH